ncbi:hypothetical protein ACI2K4_13435 [Micromonospora sp. NPDC050397]|uniref:hypothetical protein n=1 Tax=Micromonospora sp. NPDC050397 TaxID=3364279 RepID=UPI00385027B5
MVQFEYALLVRRRQARLEDTGWELIYTWYGPDGSMLDVSAYGDTALEHLNRAGLQGWDLVAVTDDSSLEGTAELHRYHLKRVLQAAPPRQRLRAGRLGRRPSPR